MKDEQVSGQTQQRGPTARQHSTTIVSTQPQPRVSGSAPRNNVAHALTPSRTFSSPTTSTAQMSVSGREANGKRGAGAGWSDNLSSTAWMVVPICLHLQTEQQSTLVTSDLEPIATRTIQTLVVRGTLVTCLVRCRIVNLR